MLVDRSNSVSKTPPPPDPDDSLSSNSSTSKSSTSSTKTLQAMVGVHEQGPVIESVTYPGYTKATKKRKIKELSDELSVSCEVGRMAVIDVPVDDVHYHLRLCLVRITAVHPKKIDFVWYVYAGYPQREIKEDYSVTWVKQIMKGKGQRPETGWCTRTGIVLTFAALTKKGTIPNRTRVSPLKMISRCLGREFGPLPQDMHGKAVNDEEWVPRDEDDSDDSSDHDHTKVNLRRSKRRVKL